MTELGSRLSANSTIFAQDDDRWENATVRWQAAYQPSFRVVVEPATEADVPVIVCLPHSLFILLVRMADLIIT